MHPAVRILALIAGILCLAGGGWSVLAAAALLISLVLAGLGQAAWRRFMSFSWRLRWFFLSILILFGWFTPGVPLFDAWTTGAPSREGLVHGAERGAVILLIVAAVVWLLESTRREDLVRGLLWLSAPLGRFGFPHERFAVRLTLVLELVPQLRDLVAARARRQQSATARGLGRWIDTAADLFRAALQHADSVPPTVMDLTVIDAPRLTHWLTAAACVVPLAVLAWWRPF